MGKVVKGALIGAVIAVVGAFALPLIGAAAPFAGLFGLGTYAAAAVGGAIIGGLGTLLAPNADLSTARGRQRVSVDPDSPMKWIFGETPCATDAIWAGHHGAENQFYSMVLAGAGHLIDSYSSLYVNDDLIAFSGNAATGDYAGALWRQTNLGSESQTSFADIDAADNFSPSLWPLTADGLGMAHYRLRWDVSHDKVKNGVPTRITQVVKGGPVYDPRLDSTRGGTGAHRADDQTTWQYNDGTTDIGANWALIVLRYLLGWKINSELVIGVGIDPDDIDMDQAMAAANVCDATVDGGPRFHIGGILPVTNEHSQIIGQLESAINGKVAIVGGKYYIWAPNDDLTPFSRIDDDDILREAGVNFTPSGPMELLFNTARGRYVDAAALYQFKPYPEVAEASAVTEDGGVRVASLDMPMIQTVARAERVARMIVRRSRFGATWRFAMGPKGLTFQPFTVTTLNCQETDFNDTTVRVIDMSFSVSGAVVLEVIEEASSIYDTTAALGTPFVNSNINGFDITDPIQMTGFNAAAFLSVGDQGSETPFATVSWTDPGANGNFIKHTEVRYKLNTDSAWTFAPLIPNDVTSAVVGPLERDSLYDFEARHVTLYDVVGTWQTDTLNTDDANNNGVSVYVANVFQRSASTPSTPAVDDGQYNFGTNTLTPPTGWSASIPAYDGNDLWVSSGGFSVIGSDGIDTTVTWTAPQKLASDGVDGSPGGDGDSIHVANCYKRSAAAPSTPTGGSYNFTTKVLTPPATWSVEPPAADGNPLYVSSATAEINGTTGTDSTLTWSTPQLLVQDGVGGISIGLNKSAVVVPTDESGNNEDFSATDVLVSVYSGGTKLSHDGVGTSNSTWKVTSITNNSCTGPTTATDSGDDAAIGDLTAMSADNANRVIIVQGTLPNGDTFSGVSVTQTFTKGKGVTGGGAADITWDGVAVGDDSTVASPSVPATVESGFRFHTDGTVDYYTSGGGWVNGFTWLNAGTNADYSVRIEQYSQTDYQAGAGNSDATPTEDTDGTTFAFGTWYLMNAIRSRQLSMAWTGPGPNGWGYKYVVQIRRDSDSVILSTAFALLDVTQEQT